MGGPKCRQRMPGMWALYTCGQLIQDHIVNNYFFTLVSAYLSRLTFYLYHLKFVSGLNTPTAHSVSAHIPLSLTIIRFSTSSISIIRFLLVKRRITLFVRYEESGKRVIVQRRYSLRVAHVRQ